MKQLGIFIQKEIRHVFRDRKTLLILLGLPIVQILLFGFALSNEIKNSKVVVIDQAMDEASRKIIARIDASRYFDVEKVSTNPKDIASSFKQGKASLALVFPINFEHDLQHLHRGNLQIIADASDPNTATTITSYLQAIIQDYQKELGQGVPLPFTIVPEMRMLYNPQLKGAPNFVPGVIALVLLLVCVMMTSISIVREKELGTMEILLVSPFKPILVIVSKAIPYLLLSIFNLCLILLLSVFVLELPVKGSLILLFAESILFIITALCLGLLISTATATQQSAMLLSLMGMLLPTLLFSGFMFPIENMPVPLQVISNIVPAKWFYLIVKSIMIKGLGFAAIWKETMILLGMTLFLLVVSLKKFNIRLA